MQIDVGDDIFLYDVTGDHSGEHHYYVSPLPNEYGFSHGLRTEAIMGELTDGPQNITPDHFKQNAVFVSFLGSIIAKHASQCPGLVAEIKRQQNGVVCILDRRTPAPDDAVPPEDIIGGVEIQNSQILQFHGSPHYQVFTKDGFMQLDGWLRERLVEELIALSDE